MTLFYPNSNFTSVADRKLFLLFNYSTVQMYSLRVFHRVDVFPRGSLKFVLIMLLNVL